MTVTPASLTRRRLKTPRAAAVAGILFALLYGTSLVLLSLSVPGRRSSDIALLATNASTIALALNLLPFAGIAFLWFIGVIRDRLGDLEDRFFSTVFLGSGLLFLATTFVGAALAGGLFSSYANASTTTIDIGLYNYGRTVMYQIINIYAVRMAGVFMISLSTIWLRTNLMHRGWVILTYALALVLLLSIGLAIWVILIFPAWVLVISIYFLIINLRDRSDAVVSEP